MVRHGVYRASAGRITVPSLVLVLLCAVLLGCATHPWRIQMTIATDANNNSPVLISVVIPKNPTLFKKLLDMTAKQWFGQ